MRVLVTRPEPESSETAARLVALGHETVVLPLTEVRPLAVNAVREVESVDAVAVTSANALRHAPPALLDPLREVPCYAVGEKTAHAAGSAGLRHVRSADGDAGALASVVRSELATGARLLYLCGRVRRPDFEAALQRSGIHVTALETYDTVRSDIGDRAVGMALASRAVDVALVYSTMAAEVLARAMALPTAAGLFSATRIFCLSRRIADALGPALSARAFAAPEPSEAAMLSLIGSGWSRLDSSPAAGCDREDRKGPPEPAAAKQERRAEHGQAAEDTAFQGPQGSSDDRSRSGGGAAGPGRGRRKSGS